MYCTEDKQSNTDIVGIYITCRVEIFFYVEDFFLVVGQATLLPFIASVRLHFDLISFIVINRFIVLKLKHT